MKYDLGYSGVPFAGGAIVVASNFTNVGQLTIRVTEVLFASDFWSNGTRQVTSGFPFNLTVGMNKEVDTPVLIPTSASIGNHNVTSTASWQYSDSSGWHTAAPAVTSITVNVSQTIGSLFSSFVTILLIGLGVAAVIVVLVVFLVVRQRRKPKPGASLPASPQSNMLTLSIHRHS
jgi:predicted PurR-regulated permease PerM